MSGVMRNERRQQAWDSTKGHCFYCGLCLLDDVTIANIERVYFGTPLSSGGWQSENTKYLDAHRRELEIDHKTPTSLGGAERSENRVGCCRSCNRSKHARTVDEYRICLMIKDCRPPLSFYGEAKQSVARDWLIVCSPTRNIRRQIAEHLGSGL